MTATTTMTHEASAADSPRKRSAKEQAELAAYHRLALQLHYDLPRGQTHRSALIVTPAADIEVAGPGSSGLGTSLADELQKSVLMVDTGGQHNELTDMLGAKGDPGMAELLAEDDLDPTQYVVETSHQHLSFLPSGHWQKPPSPERLEALLTKLHEQYDFVVCCGGPLLDNPMALAVAPLVGCVLMLVIEKRTNIDDLNAAHDALDFCHARRVGVVLTESKRGSRWR